ncbi:hypothetical protein [Larkinella arboricola]|uniref:hypothetical protein n=1 Tax=Larkinella arboricola TaxID=643671 RepID=UPI000DB9966B|nr:hypothetical protein [Larkinella arboricola]
MNRLHLTRIRALTQEALSALKRAQGGAFNNPWQSMPLAPQSFTPIFKAALQAQNLYERLEKIYLFCADLAANKIQSYREAHEWFDEEGEFSFEPFDELRRYYDDGSAYALPIRIEQYQELYQLQIDFKNRQLKKAAYLHELFGQTSPRKVGMAETGGDLLVHTTDLPAGWRQEVERDQPLKQIEVEHCLDGYDAFYEQSLALIDYHQRLGNVQACAQRILAFFKE